MPLIEQQEVLDALNAQAEEMSHWHERYAEQRKGILTAVRIVSDIKPKHGKWLLDHRCGGGFWVCSSCKYSTEALLAYAIYNFCPNCGADMRGDAE